MFLRVVTETTADGNIDDPLPSLSAGEKIVTLIRHGESIANVHVGDHFDESLRDAELTSQGVVQARSIQSLVHNLDVQIVVCSPLTRALQTACHAFEGTSIPIMAWPLLTEFWKSLPECQGRSVMKLRQCSKLTSLNRFHSVNLDNVAAVEASAAPGACSDWWRDANDIYRIQSFLAWLRHSPVTRIAVVAHFGFIHHLLRAAGASGNNVMIRNTCLIHTIWHPSPSPSLLLPSNESHNRHYSIWLMPDAPLAKDNIFYNEILQFFEDVYRGDETGLCSFAFMGGALFHITIADFVEASPFELFQLSNVLNHAVSDTLADFENLHVDCNGHKLFSHPANHGWYLTDSNARVLIHDEKTLYARIAFRAQTLARLADITSKASLYQRHPTAVRVNAEQSITLLHDDRVVEEGICLSLNDFKPLLHRRPLLHSMLIVDEVENDTRGNDTAAVTKSSWQKALAAISWNVCVVSRDANLERGWRPAHMKEEHVNIEDGIIGRELGGAHIRLEPGMVWPLFTR